MSLGEHGNGRPSCIIVTPVPPIPTRGGTYIRIASTVASLAGTYSVTVVCTRPASPEELELGRVFCAGVGAEFRYEAAGFRQPHRGWLNDKLTTLAGGVCALTERWTTQPLPAHLEPFFRSADLVWVCRLVPFMHHVLAELGNAPLIVDVDDLEERLIGLRGHGFDRLRQHVRRRKIVIARQRLLDSAAAAIVCSEIDAGRLSAPCPVWVLPNTYPVPDDSSSDQATSEAATPSVVLIGRMGYGPNRYGAEWALNEVWPIVASARPDAEFVVAGPLSDTLPCPEPALKVRLLGEVDEVESLLRASSVVLAPIHSGSGTRVKILEAFAYERPVVSTTVGAEGIDAVCGQSIMIADDPGAFAEAIIRLLNDRELARSIARAGRELFDERYSFSEFERTVLSIASAAASGNASAIG